MANLSYEHMFPSLRTSVPVQRALAALRLTRSFLTLEDDYEVDWEVDANEPPAGAHPHRAPLHGRALVDRRGLRRPGQPAPTVHACTSPIAGPVALTAIHRHQHHGRRTPGDVRTPHDHERA
jgi:hypothetical protein